MPIRIRLSRAGRKFQPVYRIRVQHSRAPRDGKYIEELGAYYPVAESKEERNQKMKVMRLEHERAKYWLSVGAQPTEAVARLFAAANLVPTPPRRDSRQTRAKALAKAAEEADG